MSIFTHSQSIGIDISSLTLQILFKRLSYFFSSAGYSLVRQTHNQKMVLIFLPSDLLPHYQVLLRIPFEF